MYAHSNCTESTRATDYYPPMHLFPEELALTDLESLLNCNNNNPEIITFNTSSSSSSYSDQSGLAMQRSVSSHSLHKNPLSGLLAELFDDDGPLRRVCSTGDLHGSHGGMLHHNNNSNESESPLSSESSMIIEGMSRASRYSPEEKKLRIERYRTKRNQRNFNKKIKYVCRKTLADSRPRIRGRFARNDEIDKNPSSVHQWSTHIGAAGAEEDEEDQNWVSIFDSLVAANTDQESQNSSSFGLLY